MASQTGQAMSASRRFRAATCSVAFHPEKSYSARIMSTLRELQLRYTADHHNPLFAKNSFAEMISGSCALISLNSWRFFMAGSMINGFKAFMSVSVES